MRLFILIISIVVLSFFIYGCSNIEPYLYKSYTLNDTISVSVGAPLIKISEGKKQVNGASENQIISGIGQELIYTGLLGNDLKLYYREYYESSTGSYARYPFYLELQYDLSQDKTIVFRDYLIEIISANQRAITFAIRQEPKKDNPSVPFPPRLETSSIVKLKLKTSSKDLSIIIISEDDISILTKNIENWDIKRYSKSDIDWITLSDGTKRIFSK